MKPHWLCRIIGHKFFKRSILAERVWGPGPNCFRCGFPLHWS